MGESNAEGQARIVEEAKAEMAKLERKVSEEEKLNEGKQS